MTVADLAAPEPASAVGRALDFLTAEQLTSGQFRTDCTSADKSGSLAGHPTVHPESSLFCSSRIAHSLTHCDDPRARSMIERVIAFLRREEERGGLWRYWCKDSPFHHTIPPDIDDTACISSLLSRFGGYAPNNQGLLIANRNSRGLFHTWMIPRPKFSANARWWWTVLSDMNYSRLVTFWRDGAKRGDIDTVINANVLLYLGERPETEAVIRWLLETANAGLEEDTDKSYRSRAAFYYAVSQCYRSGMVRFDEAKPAMQRAFSTIAHPNGKIGENVLQTALAACAVLNFELPLHAYHASFDYLLATQASDGGWEAFPFYYDGLPQPTMTWGSRAVTTGFCVEALVRMTSEFRVMERAQ